MAPEIYKKSPQDGKVDVWAFGVIAFQMFSGNILPFSPLQTTLQLEEFNELAEIERLVLDTEPDYS